MERRKVRAILFDFDGVLADTGEAVSRCASEFLRCRGIAVSADEYDRRFHGAGGSEWSTTMRGLAGSHGVTCDDRMLQELQATITDAAIAATVPMAATIDAWTAVRTIKGIVSSCPRGELLEKIRRLALEDVAIAVGAEDAARAKPYPDLYCEALRRLAVLPTDCVVIEDSAAGILAAKAAGAFSILYTQSHASIADTATIVSPLRTDS